MRRSIFMYLFLFAALWIVFQYVNASKVFDKQQDQIERLRDKLHKAEDSLSKVGDLNDSRYFKLTGNENAYDYFDRFGIDITDLDNRIETALISKNSTSGNPLIPYENATGIFQINKVEVLNHKWVIADFSDGKRWGELILLYDVAQDGSISFETLQSVIYP